MEFLYSDVFEAVRVGRRFDKELDAGRGQTRARWQAMWVIGQQDRLAVPQVARHLGVAQQSAQRVIDCLVTEAMVDW